MFVKPIASVIPSLKNSVKKIIRVEYRFATILIKRNSTHFYTKKKEDTIIQQQKHRGTMFNSNTYCVKMQDFNQKGSVLVNDKLTENKIK